MKDVFGIDLGTTNSCIAIIDDNNLPLVLKNLEDEFTTPSVVAYDDDDEPYAGKEAKNNLGNDPERTVAFIKREMSNANYQRQIGGKNVSPIEISAIIIKKLVDDANEQRVDAGKAPIHKAVITVPAYFGNAERENTRQAGEIAGLEVLDLLNEPTAAALSYGASKLENKTILIYDLGGGTFDVSIMRIQGNNMDTLATEGNHHLGGVDWDECLVDYGLLDQKLEVQYKDIQYEKEAGKMLLNSELCKKKLSESPETTFKFMYKRKQHMVRITQEDFEELTQHLLDQTIDLVKKAMKSAGNPHIDEIILVGGSSRMPMVKARLQREFSIPLILDRFEPDLAIAKGAALRAAQLTGERMPIRLGKDKGSRSYGMRTFVDGKDEKIANLLFKSDDLVFHQEFSSFSTRDNDQKSVNIAIYENESNENYVDVNKGILMAEGAVTWGFPVPANTPIKLILDRGHDGIVKVWAGCQGKEVSFNVSPQQRISEDDKRMLTRELNKKRV